MVYDNSPALSWVRMTDTIVTYKNKIYIIPNESTEKKYIYWDAETPSRFIFTNEIQTENPTKFLVLINDNGMHTIVHSKVDYFNISFDNGNIKRIEQKIYGMYSDYNKSDKEHTAKFSTITQEIGEIRTVVGEFTESNKKQLTELKQNADEISAMARETKSTLSTVGLRDDVVKAYMNVIECLGKYQITMQSIMADEKLDFDGDGTEIDDIDAYNKLLRKFLDELKTVLNNFLDSESASHLPKEKVSVIKENVIPTMDRLYEDLIETIEYAGQDKIYDATDRKNIYEQFAKFIGVLNGDKDLLDELLVLGSGGKMIDTIGNLFLNKDSGGFNFVERMDNMDMKVAKLNVGLSGISTTMSQNVEVINNDIKGAKDELNKTKDGLNGKIDDVTTRIVKAESSIEQTIEEIRSRVSMDKFESEIKQLKNSISSKVSEGDMYSLIKQNSDAIKIGFNNIDSSSFTINRNGLIVRNGCVAVNTLTVPDGEYPVISLFKNENGGSIFSDSRTKPEIDCSEFAGTGVGSSIRMKITDTDYLKMSRKHFEVVMGDYGKTMFRVKPSGAFFVESGNYEKKLATEDYVSSEVRNNLPNIKSSRFNGGVYIEVDGVRIRVYDNGNVDHN